MIPAGKLNKVITVQTLNKTKDDFGSEDEIWVDVCKAKSQVIGFDRDSFFTVNSENLIQNRLQFTVRSYVAVYLRKEPINYRIIYGCKKYRILNINAEITGQLNILTELIND